MRAERWHEKMKVEIKQMETQNKITPEFGKGINF
jgi:hypothetical protein